MSVSRITTWITWITDVILVFIISLAFYSTFPVITEKKLTIPKPVTEENIITHLSKNGYNVGKIDQLFFSKFGKLKHGEIHFKEKSINRIDFLYALREAKQHLVRLTLIPGETTEIFLDTVAKKLDVNKSRLMLAYKTNASYPEAGIAADTYLAPKKMNEEKLMKFLLSSSQRAYKKLALKYYDDYNKTKWHEILTIASIIQKEAANNKEMPIISSVIYNRLKKNMRLQMDGTLNYGKYSHIKVTPERIKNDLSTFNTYKHKGLPTSPIGSVSPTAIKAAIQPASTDYLYFMRNKQGVHDFTDTFKKHRKNIVKTK